MGGVGSGGANRKPVSLHRLQGTFRADRHARPPVEASPVEPLGPPPRSEPAAVRTHYARLRALLGPQGARADAAVVLLTARALAELDDPSLLALRADAWRRSLAGLRALRLTPSSRKAPTPTPSRILDARNYSSMR
jgi:hypothetical protein